MHLIAAVDSDGSPRQLPLWLDLATSPSSPVGVRPQWTPRTSAGRAKLMTESANWELAEEERVLQRERDLQIEQQQWQRRELTAALAEQRKDALETSRENHRVAVRRISKEAKDESDGCRRQHAVAREAFQDRASKTIPRAQENQERVRREQMRMHEDRSSHVAAQNAERQRADYERQREIAEHKASARARADERKRVHTYRAHSTKARELRSREANVDEMRQKQASREGALNQYKEQVRQFNRCLRDGVATSSSPDMVRDFKARERARKAALSGQVKDQLERDRQEFEAARRSEEERKRAMHDDVRRAATGGFGDRRRAGYGVKYSGTSCYSQSRHDGRHDFRHELPTTRSPAGRWLREYAQSYVRTRNEARLSPASSPETTQAVRV